MKPSDVVTNGHIHTSEDSGTLLGLRIIAIYTEQAWCLALSGPHKGHLLTFELCHLKYYEEELSHAQAKVVQPDVGTGSLHD